MLGKYINQFMPDNELSVNEEFFIENMDGNRVLIGCADRYKIEDVDGGILTAAVMNEKDKPPAMLLEAALIDLLRENYLVKKKPFYPSFGERYYHISPSGNVIYANFAGCAEDLDSDFRNEMSAVFYKNSDSEVYKPGDRVCQLVIMPIPAIEFIEVDELSETERGANGFGSTGVR